MIGGDFKEFCGLLRIYELYTNIQFLSRLVLAEIEWMIHVALPKEPIHTFSS